MGVTHPEEKWGAKDYKYAIALFDQIYEADKFSLPRRGSTFSGKLFERLINRKNFDFLIDESTNFGVQIIEYEKIKGIGFRLLIYYIEDTEPAERFGAEVIDCMMLDAWLSTQGIVMYEKLAKQLSPQQAGSPNFRRGFEQSAREFKRAMEEIFYILEGDSARYERDLLVEFAAVFGNFMQQLPDRKGTEGFHYRYEQLTKNFHDKDIRKILKSFL